MTTEALWTVTPYQSACYLCLHPTDNRTATEKAVFFFGRPQYVATLVFELSHTSSFVKKKKKKIVIVIVMEREEREI